MSQQDILLSICIPAYNRPVWFERALESIVSNIAENKQCIEVIISDDSNYNECRVIANKVLETRNVNYKYIHNQPKLGMATNWNNAIRLALGKHVLVLHDDDFLLNNGINEIIKAIRNNQEEYPVMLFGVHVVNEQEKVIKKQLFKRKLYLPPKKALLKVLSNSSFIRFPGIVIRRDIFEKVGYFDSEIGEVSDLDMWIRLLSNYGLLCLPDAVSAYRAHTNALTTGMFNEETIKKMLNLFTKIKSSKLLSSKIIERSKSNFLHQFILAGTYRKIKQKQFMKARKVMQLFRLDSIRQLSLSVKWLFLRSLFRIVLLV